LLRSDRRSYKSSEVVSLFILSVIAGMIFCGICAAVDFLLTHVLRISGGA
jgi:hypothetical protein